MARIQVSSYPKEIAQLFSLVHRLFWKQICRNPIIYQGSVNTNFVVTDDEGIDSVRITVAGTTTTINYETYQVLLTN